MTRFTTFLVKFSHTITHRSAWFIGVAGKAAVNLRSVLRKHVHVHLSVLQSGFTKVRAALCIIFPSKAQTRRSPSGPSGKSMCANLSRIDSFLQSGSEFPGSGPLPDSVVKESHAKEFKPEKIRHEQYLKIWDTLLNISLVHNLNVCIIIPMHYNVISFVQGDWFVYQMKVAFKQFLINPSS